MTEAEVVDEPESLIEGMDEVQVGVEALIGEERDELDLLVRGVQAVHAARPLHSYLRVPVQVEVDDRLGELQVVALCEHVGRNEHGRLNGTLHALNDPSGLVWVEPACDVSALHRIHTAVYEGNLGTQRWHLAES